jgi:hypothetical protein
MTYAENRKKAFLERIKDFPWYKRWWEKTKYFVEHSEGFAVVFICICVWIIGLIPTGLFSFIWWLLGPTTFWAKFATIAFIGLPLLPFIIGGIFLAGALTIIAITEGI